MTDIFPLASTARSLAQDNVIIVEEVRDIEIAVYGAIAAGQLTVVVSSGTPMTDSVTGVPYYNAWQNLTPSTTLSNQISVVINYFQGLGYSIAQTVNPSTNNTFVWTLNW